MYKIAVIPGDGIGTEVISSGVEVLKALSKVESNLPIEFTEFDWGSDHYRKHGVMMPEDGVEELKNFNSICFIVDASGSFSFLMFIFMIGLVLTGIMLLLQKDKLREEIKKLQDDRYRVS